MLDPYKVAVATVAANHTVQSEWASSESSQPAFDCTSTLQ